MPHRKFTQKKGRMSQRRPLAKSRGRLGKELNREKEKILHDSRMVVWEGNPPPFPRCPSRSLPGSTGIVRQISQTFTTNTGLSTGNRLVASNSAPVMWAIAFLPTDMPGITSLAAAYDQYRVEKLHFRFSPYTNASNVTTNSSTLQFVPNLGCVVDHDDATALAAPADALQYDSCQIVPGYAGLSVEFVPSITQAVFAGGVFSGYSVIPSNLADPIDMANLSVPHYGLKGYVDQISATSTAAWAWTVTVSATVSFFNGR